MWSAVLWGMVWFEISTQKAANYLLLVTAPPPHVISKHFRGFQKNLDITNDSVRWLGISLLLTSTGWAACSIKLSVLFKIKDDAICTSNSPFVLTQYVLTDPVSAIPILSAHCLLPLLLSSWSLPPPIDNDIALYLHNSVSQHEHSYSKYALADSSLVFSFAYNCDRYGVYSKSAVGVAAHCFTDVILQDTELSILLVPTDSTNSLTGFLTHWYTVFWKRITFVRNTTKQIPVI
jgi:hypothetical protein